MRYIPLLALLVACHTQTFVQAPIAEPEVIKQEEELAPMWWEHKELGVCYPLSSNRCSEGYREYPIDCVPPAGMACETSSQEDYQGEDDYHVTLIRCCGKSHPPQAE